MCLLLPPDLPEVLQKELGGCDAFLLLPDILDEDGRDEVLDDEVAAAAGLDDTPAPDDDDSPL